MVGNQTPSRDARRSASNQSTAHFSLAENSLHLAISSSVRKQPVHSVPVELSTQILLHGDGGSVAFIKVF
jgi:hypothetical protein